MQQSIAMREHLEGISVAGHYVLQQWLGGDETAGFFLTTFGPDGQRAVLKLIPEDTVDATRQLALWRRTVPLRHPNLLEMLDCGRADAGGNAFLYAVLEYPDDRASMALEQRTLSEPEAQEVLTSALEALRYLHGKGFVYGPLGADRVVAVGERIKLSSDSLREPGDGSGSSEEDVRALGELLYLLVTGRRAEGGAIKLLGVGEPLRTVIRHALVEDPRGRWTLEEISAALERPMAPAEPEPIPAASIELPAERLRAQKSAPPPFPKWIFGGVAGLLLIIVAMNLGRKSGAGTEPRPLRPAPGLPAAGSAPSQPSAQPPSQPAPVRQAPVQQAVRAAAPPSIKKPPPAPTKAGSAIWRVIAYTYASRTAAENKARSVNEKWPELHAAVFAPRQRTGFYLVSLGGRMTKDDALRLQKRARGDGLPRDTFVQNYSD
jgi:eukaryotic-like serine/threonine-protein kinase